jgi:hypothetical protein
VLLIAREREVAKECGDEPEPRTNDPEAVDVLNYVRPAKDVDAQGHIVIVLTTQVLHIALIQGELVVLEVYYLRRLEGLYLGLTTTTEGSCSYL